MKFHAKLPVLQRKHLYTMQVVSVSVAVIAQADTHDFPPKMAKLLSNQCKTVCFPEKKLPRKLLGNQPFLTIIFSKICSKIPTNVPQNWLFCLLICLEILQNLTFFATTYQMELKQALLACQLLTCLMGRGLVVC